MTSKQFLGSTASALANLLLLGGLTVLWPRAAALAHAQGPESMVTIDLWRPYIDNPGIMPGSDRDPDCPLPQANTDLYNLEAAPVPDAWDPDAKGNLYACVLVAPRGRVLDAQILKGSGRAALDRQLADTIRRDWRFQLVGGEPDAPSWQRIRINSGPANGMVWDPLPSF
jgi:hypothetical protein